MSQTISRRQMLFATGAAMMGAGPLLGRSLSAARAATPKVLFQVVASKDGTLFDPDKIGQFDAFVFETTGILTEKGDHNDGPPMSADGKKA